MSKFIYFQVRIPVNDQPHDQIQPFFDQVADLINENTNCGKRTVVHCIAGVSRSATLCIAYLMKYNR